MNAIESQLGRVDISICNQVLQAVVEMQLRCPESHPLSARLRGLEGKIGAMIGHNICQGHKSSNLHLEVSRVLSYMGVVHENEKLMPIGAYRVDIFVETGAISTPREDEELSDDSWEPTSSIKSKYVASKGVVIEVDGPMHFDSYGKRPLGHTVLKRRHIEASGYTLIPLPHWDFRHQYSLDKKVKVLRGYLDGRRHDSRHSSC
jgi:RAP domain